MLCKHYSYLTFTGMLTLEYNIQDNLLVEHDTCVQDRWACEVSVSVWLSKEINPLLSFDVLEFGVDTLLLLMNG